MTTPANFAAIHQLLRYPPGSKRTELRIEIEPVAPLHPHQPQKLALLKCEGQEHTFEYSFDIKIPFHRLLANYPVPVYINGQSAPRSPWPDAPTILKRPATLPRSDDAAPEMLGHQTTRLNVPSLTPIHVDGLNYARHHSVASTGITAYIPNPTVSNKLCQACDSYDINAYVSIQLPTDDSSHYFIQDHLPTFFPSDQAQERIAASIQDNHRTAAAIIGVDIDQLRKSREVYHDPSDHNAVVPITNVTPVVVDFDKQRYFTDGVYKGPALHQSRRPIAHSVIRHLQENTHLGLLPVAPPYENPEFAVVNIDNVIVTPFTQHQDRDADQSPFVVQHITIQATVVHPDASAEHLSLNADTAFLGTAEDPQPMCSHLHRPEQAELADRIFEAYERTVFIPRHEDEVRSAQLFQTAQNLAHRILHGETSAYLQEVYAHWRTFKPSCPRPQSLTDAALAQEICEYITD